jgi:hypothetical protein
MKRVTAIRHVAFEDLGSFAGFSQITALRFATLLIAR